jgi:ABC-2 type transport system ATP-binding protein
MTTALEITDVHKSFGKQKVLDGLSLRVEEGEIVGLLGPNGCGKSTVLNIIGQLLLPDAGQISLMGQALHPSNGKARSRVGFCAQRCALYPDLFPAENLHFFGRLHGLSEKGCQQRVAELMRTFSLSAFSEHTRWTALWWLATTFALGRCFGSPTFRVGVGRAHSSC